MSKSAGPTEGFHPLELANPLPIGEPTGSMASRPTKTGVARKRSLACSTSRNQDPSKIQGKHSWERSPPAVYYRVSDLAIRQQSGFWCFFSSRSALKLARALAFHTLCFHLSPPGAVVDTKENAPKASPAQKPSAMRAVPAFARHSAVAQW